jgi:hypothetical protein
MFSPNRRNSRTLQEAAFSDHLRYVDDFAITTGSMANTGWDYSRYLGDLGTTAAEVEKALEVNFALANRWDCVLLLDEADVFLAERTKEDFKRNGLVAGVSSSLEKHLRHLH